MKQYSSTLFDRNVPDWAEDKRLLYLLQAWLAEEHPEIPTELQDARDPNDRDYYGTGSAVYRPQLIINATESVRISRSFGGIDITMFVRSVAANAVNKVTALSTILSNVTPQKLEELYRKRLEIQADGQLLSTNLDLV